MKNRLKQLIRKPIKLIYAIIMLAVLILILVDGGKSVNTEDLRSAKELVAMVAAFYIAMFTMTVNSGFSRGGNLFSLSDAALLFTAPIRPQTILFYGLMRQISTSLVVGFFLMFQYGTLSNLYGISGIEMVGLLVLYGCSLFIGQVGAMMIYAFTSHDERKKKAGRILLTGTYAMCFLWLAAKCLPYGLEGLLERAVDAATGGFLYLVPIGGWLGLAAKGLMNSQPALIVQGLGLCAAATALMIWLLFRMDPDYYEDVLKSAEINYSAITGKKEGTMQEALPDNIKVGKMGLGSGWGASAFFRKHLLENRRSRKFILPANSLVFMVIVIAFCLFTKDTGLLPAFIMATYLQLFSSMLTGRFNYELTRPYLYLVPETAMKKLLWALGETLPAVVLDAIVVFVPAGVILSASPIEIVILILARVSCGIAYLAADIAVERIWGSSISKILITLLFFVISLLIMAPGIALAFIGGLGWNMGVSGSLLLLALGNLPMSLLTFYLCRNLLEYAELSNQ